MGLNDRLRHSWDAFMNKDPTYNRNYGSGYRDYGTSYGYRPDRLRRSRGNEKSIITSVYNRIALDAAAIKVEHVRLDKEDRYLETISSCLNECLTTESNLDQTGRALMQDIVMSMQDEGSVAIVPVTTDIDPNATESYKILELRVGKVIEWRPAHVKVQVYNEQTGQQEDVFLPKSMVAIVENPFYAVMNEPNSTMQRLIRKLNLLDVIDEQSGSGKLDLLIQLPYIVKTPERKRQAEERRKAIEEQLKGPYGIAYTDGTEKVTQLNRPIENNLMKQIEYLTSMLYSQLGLTTSVMDGTADDKTMNNYYTRTIEPILSAIVDEMKRKFLTKAARTQKQSIRFFRDPFKLVPISELPDIADKFTRNEIMTSNEMRQVIGMKPSADPNADQLRNKNLNQSQQGNPTSPQSLTEPDSSIQTTENPSNQTSVPPETPMTLEEYQKNMKDLEDIDSELDGLDNELNDELKHYASDYYDSAKAHDYYERTKELKGRKSTSGLNDSGKAAADYVREQLNTEKKQKVDTAQKSLKEQLETHKAQMKEKINSLRSRLKNMSKAQKAANRDDIMSEIDGIRAENKAAKDQLQEAFKKTKTDLKTEYDDKYVAELDKIKSTGSFKAPVKAKAAQRRKKTLEDFRI